MTATATPTATAIEPGRDPRIEAMLDRHHVTWAFDPALELGQVDLKKSLQNQARADGEPLIAETVELYTHHYKEGATFPGVLARRTSPRAKKVVLLGGNHRTHGALSAGLHTHPAYVIECTDEAAVSLMYEDNMANGAQLPKAQRMAIAIHLMAIGWTQARAAKEMGVTQSELSNAGKMADTTRRAHTLKVPGFDDLPAIQRLEVGRIASDPVFAETARLLVATKPKGEDANRLIKRVKSQRSDTDALALVAAELEARREEVQRAHVNGKAGTYVKRTTYGKVKGATLDIVGANPRDVAASMPASVDRKAFRAQLRDVAKHLMKIAEAV